MSIDTIVPKHPWSPPSFFPDELPSPLDDETIIKEEEEPTLSEDEIWNLRPHNFAQYREHSRHVARLQGFRPAYSHMASATS